MAIDTSGLSGYAKSWAESYNKSISSGKSQTDASNSATSSANKSTYGSSKAPKSSGSSGGSSENKGSGTYYSDGSFSSSSGSSSGSKSSGGSSSSSKPSPPSYDFSQNTPGYGYNPYNGNYYGDGRGQVLDSQGRPIANINTGAYYQDTTDKGTTPGGTQLGSKFARSDTGFKSNYDYQTGHINDFLNTAKAQNNQTALAYGNEQLRRLQAGEDLGYTQKFDYRGFGTNGSFDTLGREFSFDPWTGQMAGNLSMQDQNYNLMFDPRFNYGQNYFQDAYANSQFLKDAEAEGKLVQGETANSLANEYANRWLDANSYKQDDSMLKSVNPLAISQQTKAPIGNTQTSQNLATGMPTDEKQVQAKLGGYDWSQWQDRDKALAEIARSGEVYNENKRLYEQTGDQKYKDAMDAAHRHANGVRQASGINGDGRTTTGLEGSKYDPANIRTQQDAQAMATEIVQMPEPQQMDIMRMINEEYIKLQQEIAQRAETEAKMIAKQKLDALTSLADQIKAQRDQSLDLIKNSVQDSEQSLERDSFQAWLNARQGMANRGLSGSGIASDQDLRLMMARNQDLAGIYRDAQTRSTGIQSQFDEKLSDLYGQMQQIDPSQIQSDLYSKYMATDGKMLNDRLGQIADIYKHQTPSGTSMLNSQTEMYKFNNLSQDRRMELQYKYDQLTQQGKYKEADLMMEMQKMGLDAMRIMGVDANGNPTLDARKLSEQIRHNQSSEGISALNAQISAGRLEETIRSNDIRAEQFKIEQNNTELKGQASALQTLITQSGRQLSDLVALKKSGNGGANIDAQIRSAQEAYYANTKALEVLQGLSQQSISPSQAGLNYGNGTPSSTFANFQ